MAIRLRPHHLFCVQGYQGKGYSKEFCDNMAKVARAVEADPHLPIMVLEGPDDICMACPHLRGVRCTWGEVGEEAVREHDQALLRALGLADGVVVSIAEVMAVLRADARAREVVAKYCSACPWVGDCNFAALQGIVGRHASRR